MYIDLLIRIKNAQAAGRDYLKIPYSKMDKEIANILEKQGFLKKVEMKGRLPKKILKIYLNPKRPIKGLKFLSRPSIGRYSGYRDLKPVKGGYGLLVLSTPKGIMSGSQARKEKVGGKLLFEIW